ncbi:MAG: hypothetical protein C0P72_008905, partial [Clostridia bacterium]
MVITPFLPFTVKFQLQIKPSFANEAYGPILCNATIFAIQGLPFSPLYFRFYIQKSSKNYYSLWRFLYTTSTHK